MLTWPDRDEMTVISLTSIPPRFDRLRTVLDSLTSQGASHVVLTLPRQFSRFPGTFDAPGLPHGVDLLWADEDFGPATKLIPAQAAFPGEAIAYCDDDCLMQPGWLGALEAHAGARRAVAGSVFELERLKRKGGVIAQGFAGVLLPAGMQFSQPPAACRNADDLWFSAQLEQTGVEIVPCHEARAKVTPFHAPDPLQGPGRAKAYTQAAAHIHAMSGLWPPLAGA